MFKVALTFKPSYFSRFFRRMSFVSQARSVLKPCDVQVVCPSDFKVVLYHANCVDGFGAAFSALHYAQQKKLQIDAIPVSHGQNPPFEALQGRNVLIADFSYKKVRRLFYVEEVHAQIVDSASKVLVLDHHVSGQSEHAETPGCFFDMSMSGASM